MACFVSRWLFDYFSPISVSHFSCWHSNHFSTWVDIWKLKQLLLTNFFMLNNPKFCFKLILCHIGFFEIILALQHLSAKCCFPFLFILDVSCPRQPGSWLAVSCNWLSSPHPSSNILLTLTGILLKIQGLFFHHSYT